MKKTLTLSALLLFSFSVNAQKGTKLYKGLVEGMTIKEAKKTIKKNKAEYNEVSFGNGFVWTIKGASSLMNASKGADYLAGIMMWPKGSLLSGIGYSGTKNYLEASERFFVERGFKDLIRNKWWNAPLNFDEGGYKYGLVMISPEGDRVIHMYPMTYPSPLNPDTNQSNAYIQLYSKGQWDKMMDSNEAKKSKDTANTDF